jgi:cytochrome P450
MEMVKERRERPRQDLLGKFVAFEAAGDRLSEAELLNTCVTLFTAGHETTLSFISNTIYTLLSHPEQFQLLKADPGLLTPALEESLRFESPVSRQSRLMKTDKELGGQLLKKGQVVMQMLNSANRDPQYFDEPDKFDIRRQNNRHMAFGQGIHFCVGATLARTEATIAIGTVIKRFPNMRLGNTKPNWDTSKRNSRVLLSLDVTL